jgi:hypothetical protein
MESSGVIFQFRAAVETAVRELLETKHLYQSVRISLEPIRAAISASKATFVESGRPGPFSRGSFGLTAGEIERHHVRHKQELGKILNCLTRNDWKLVTEDLRDIPLRSNHPDSPNGEPICFLPTICRGCCHCDAVRPPHNPGYFGSQKPEPLLDVVMPRVHNRPTTQYWSIAYQCQSCRAEPVVYSVRREGEKLQIVGRSLFDRVSIPRHYPTHLHRFYSETQIARTAGKPLPGSLYLRLLIEHYMRSVLGIAARVTGDELADAYSQRLSPNFPRSEASLKEVYAILSSIIHEGRDDSDILDAMIEKVDRHFRLLELIPIPQSS